LESATKSWRDNALAVRRLITIQRSQDGICVLHLRKAGTTGAPARRVGL
jgi:hypothetical protein